MSRDGGAENQRAVGEPAVSGQEGSLTARLADAAHVTSVRESMPSLDEVADLADVFNLLGEPSRVSILIALLPGPMAVRDLAAVVGMSESAASHSLRLLRAHRIVHVHREGRNAYYALADSHVRLLLDLALEHVGHSLIVHAIEPEGGTDGIPGAPAPQHCI